MKSEMLMTTILHQLPELTEKELEMVADYIKGLRLAWVFTK